MIEGINELLAANGDGVGRNARRRAAPAKRRRRTFGCASVVWMLARLLKTRVPLTGGRSEALEPHVVGCGVVASAPARGGQVGDEHVGGAVAAIEPHAAVLTLARLRRLGPCAVKLIILQ